MPNEKRSARLEMRAQMLKALAHPTRLLIVEQLAGQERCVYELQQMVGCDMSTMSKHLALLRSAGLVDDEKRGNQVFYTLRTPCILKIFDCVEQAVRSDLKRRVEVMR